MDKYNSFKIDTVDFTKVISFKDAYNSIEKIFVVDLLHFVLQATWSNLNIDNMTPYLVRTQVDNSSCFQLCFDDKTNYGLFIKYDENLKNPLSVKVVAPSLDGSYAHTLFFAVNSLFTELQRIKVCPTVFKTCQELSEHLTLLKKQIQSVSLSTKLYPTIYQESLDQNNNLFAIFSRDNIFAYWTDAEMNKDFLIQYDTVDLKNSESKYFLSIKSRNKSSSRLSDINSHWYKSLKNEEWQLLEYFSWNSIKELEYMLNTPTHLKAFSILLNCIKKNNLT